jgi:hypothetical protein
MRQAAGSVGGSIRRLTPGGGGGPYHQCWSRIAFLQVLGKTLGARGSSVVADSSAPLNRNLNAYIKTLEPVISRYRVHIYRTARRVRDYSG